MAVTYEIPSGWRLAGYEPAFICLLPDGSTELLANLSGGALGGIETGLIAVDHPQGVYMLTMVPQGSLSALHNQQHNKYVNFMWGL